MPSLLDDWEEDDTGGSWLRSTFGSIKTKRPSKNVGELVSLRQSLAPQVPCLGPELGQSSFMNMSENFQMRSAENERQFLSKDAQSDKTRQP